MHSYHNKIYMYSRNFLATLSQGVTATGLLMRGARIQEVQTSAGDIATPLVFSVRQGSLDRWERRKWLTP